MFKKIRQLRGFKEVLNSNQKLLAHNGLVRSNKFNIETINSRGFIFIDMLKYSKNLLIKEING